jgi:fatty-acid desaturase
MNNQKENDAKEKKFEKNINKNKFERFLMKEIKFAKVMIQLIKYRDFNDQSFI